MCLVLVIRAPVAIDLGVSVAGKHSVDDLVFPFVKVVAVGIAGCGVLLFVLVPHTPFAAREAEAAGGDDPRQAEFQTADMLPIKQIGRGVVLDGRLAALIGVNADDVGNVHMIELVVGIVDDLGSPIDVASELKIEIKRAAVVPVDTVGRLGNADIRAVAIGDSLHLLIGSSLGVEHIKHTVGFLADHHRIGRTVKNRISEKRCRDYHSIFRLFIVFLKKCPKPCGISGTCKLIGIIALFRVSTV